MPSQNIYIIYIRFPPVCQGILLNKVYVNAPEGAEVYLDGNYVGIAPCSFRKATGAHVVTLRKRCHLKTSTLFISGFRPFVKAFCSIILILRLFLCIERAAREGRNPQTGKAMKIAASKAPKFKAGKALKDMLN